ncbi:MAG: CPXCG motif-containing cysteine-rich protein [Bacteroidota bacterium]
MEHEHHFTCPYCWETISMLLDVTVMGRQVYVEDCEVCCNPIQLAYASDGAALTAFEAEPLGQ